MKALFFSLCLIIPVFSQPIPFPQDTIAYNDLFNNRMFPVYDSQGKIHLTYTGQSGTNGATREIYYVKEEPNGSFTTTNITNNAVDDNYSTLSVDPGDKLHVVYEARDAGNLFQVYYKNNYSGVFDQPITITAGGLNKATPFSKVGPDSVVHIVYFTFTAGTDYAYYTRFDARDSILQLTPTTLAAAEAGGDFEASVDVDTNGHVHVVVKAGALSGTLKYYNDISGSLTEVPTGVTSAISNPKVLIDKGNKVHILYRNETELRFYMINNIGGTFSTPVPVTPVGQRPAFQQNLALDSLNRIYIVYQSSVSTSGKGFYFIYEENGVFSDTMRVYDLSPEYVTRNSTAVIARGDGQMAIFYAPGGVRATIVIADIFMKRGLLSDTPVELVSFTGSASGSDIILNWTTASEVNNKGFEIERKTKDTWDKIAFINGRGTTTSGGSYSFTDTDLPAARYTYRLKQLDFNGTSEYSNEIEIELAPASDYTLEQNYPNPFNPSTVIGYTAAEPGWIKLKIYNTLGEEIAVLVNEQKDAGEYQVTFDAKNLPSGTYFYRLETGSTTIARKMLLAK